MDLVGGATVTGGARQAGHDGEGETTTGAVGYIYTPPKSHTRLLNLTTSLADEGQIAPTYFKLSLRLSLGIYSHL